VNAQSEARIYFGHVMHSRLKPRRHRFRYRVFSLLLDVDRLPGLASRLKLFSLDRFNLFSVHRRDHGDGATAGLRPWAEAQLAAAGVADASARIELLCFPRVMGYVFNPLSIWFCHGADGGLRALIYEVHNTFGERHAYVRPVGAAPAPGKAVVQRADKTFYVSPFIGMQAEYRFRVHPPDERLAVAIREYDQEGELLRATLTGRGATLTDRALLRAFFAYPLMTIKVTAAIYWHAFRLWRKRVPAFPHRRKAADQGMKGV
jgi:DUF1365 family protein